MNGYHYGIFGEGTQSVTSKHEIMQQDAARIYIKGPNSVVKMLELALNKQPLGQVPDMNS